MKVSEIDDIEQILSNTNGVNNVKRYSEGISEFKRFISFTVDMNEYIIEWYANISTLWVNNLAIRFTGVEVSGTWPNGFKNNLQFYMDNDIVAVLGVEKYNN